MNNYKHYMLTDKLINTLEIISSIKSSSIIQIELLTKQGKIVISPYPELQIALLMFFENKEKRLREQIIEEGIINLMEEYEDNQYLKQVKEIR